eukprot:CAMPEP_0197673356 /NCGR_PEP_ID=MMETSP1338-20131121/80786_1 /TAXON_ID=43686 ORGANISM="Pelagodinium beii, Strain RCC1491" /NCGR_SAMPLE_ID=MMETSP1338 /ASSEMBLY_ACC=CAM_ASM_000754 /LENGTH=96 /DNA_ID=CAMNT_0043253595 /DNA_START=54 /DNA_END=344 /DNA_ORIENTATION=-
MTQYVSKMPSDRHDPNLGTLVAPSKEEVASNPKPDPVSSLIVGLQEAAIHAGAVAKAESAPPKQAVLAKAQKKAREKFVMAAKNKFSVLADSEEDE